MEDRDYGGGMEGLCDSGEFPAKAEHETFRAGRGTGTAILEEKLAHQLA